MMVYINCKLCGSNDYKLLFKKKDYTYQISEIDFCVVKCKQCGLVYVNPRPDENEIHNYYPNEFYQTNITKEKLLEESQFHNELKYSYIKELKPGCLLDIGCNKGEFMYYMEKKGWDVYGVEFSIKPPNMFDKRIFYGDIKKADFNHEQFDLITMWAVLEHVYEPMEMLQYAYKLLKKNGIIVILVTNFKAFPGWFMQQDDIPRHTTLFTKNTLKCMLNKSGFKNHKFYYNHLLFGGRNRGLFNYIIKLMLGENKEDIVAQNRTPGRWQEFSSKLKTKDSKFMQYVDKFDIWITPYIDIICDILGLGMIMISKSQK